MSKYVVCTHCGKTYDINDSWQWSDHVDGICENVRTGFCESCGGGTGDLHTANSGETVHKHTEACIFHLREQVRYMEEYRLEHDARYCALEKAVQGLVNGRKAALEESRTLKAIREKGNDRNQTTRTS